MNDVIAEEVRAVRRDLSARFDFDVKRICEHIMLRQRNSGKKYVSQPPVEPRQVSAAASSAAAEQGAEAGGGKGLGASR